MKYMVVVAMLVVGCGGAVSSPCDNPPPNTACATLSPSAHEDLGECPGPANDAGEIGCDDETVDGCVCNLGGRDDMGEPLEGSCRSGVCVPTP